MTLRCPIHGTLGLLGVGPTGLVAAQTVTIPRGQGGRCLSHQGAQAVTTQAIEAS